MIARDCIVSICFILLIFGLNKANAATEKESYDECGPYDECVLYDPGLNIVEDNKFPKYDSATGRCFYVPETICDSQGACTHAVPQQVPCPLDFEIGRQDNFAVKQFYREVLDVVQLPSERVIEEAKAERDRLLDQLEKMIKQAKEEVNRDIQHITDMARKESATADAAAFKKMMAPRVDAELIRAIVSNITHTMNKD